MARLNANENFLMPVVEELRRLGHDVMTTHEAGKAGQAIADDEVLNFACSDRRAVLTLNRKHFILLHNVKAEHEGIIVCTFDPDFAAQALRINTEIASHTELSRQLIRVSRAAK